MENDALQPDNPSPEMESHPPSNLAREAGRTPSRRLLLALVEILLVLVILALLLATWLPAIVGGNPAAR
jgi:hypothetical protein